MKRPDMGMKEEAAQILETVAEALDVRRGSPQYEDLESEFWEDPEHFAVTDAEYLWHSDRHLLGYIDGPQ